MARRFDRTYTRLPVELVAENQTHKFEAPASVIDISKGGLRVQTGPSLIPGQILNVFVGGKPDQLARCRVAWSQTHGSALPSEAGLEFLGTAPWLTTLRIKMRALA